MVRRTTILECIFNSRVRGLNCLLSEWEVAARDCVKIVLFGDLRLHDFSCMVGSICGKEPWPKLFTVDE
jgi:hypothetical protein